MESEALVQHQFFPGTLQQNPLDRRYTERAEWDVKAWEWDGLLLLAQPSAAAATDQQQQHSSGKRPLNLIANECKKVCKSGDSPPHNSVDEDDPEDGLALKLGGRIYSTAAADAGSGKRQRSSSPVAEQQQQQSPQQSQQQSPQQSPQQQSQQQPVCQVDGCTSDLSHAKDYHRRHKVCEMHSKAANASVGRVMQRFCQQCSRFHSLQEFDEGKRSCRRRLAGHNRRRRKTQPDAAAAQAYLFAEEDVAAKSALVLRLLQLLSQMQAASNLEKATTGLQDRELALEYLKRATSVSTAIADLSSTKVEDKTGLKPATSLLEAFSILLQAMPEQQSLRQQQQQQQQQHHLMAQGLYGPSTLHQSAAAPVHHFANAQRPFAVHSNNGTTNTTDPSLGGTNRPGSLSGFPAVAAPATMSIQVPQSSESMSGSDQSPESTSTDVQERTGRISFKLFNRTPGDFPQVLRSQIVEWLSHVPSEMESYIRPGCVVLSIFLSMPFSAWKNLCNDFVASVRRLIDANPSSEFWHKGHILVQVDAAQAAYVVDGAVRALDMRKNPPRVLRIRPVAMTVGQKTDFVIEGYELDGSNRSLLSAYENKYDSLPCERLEYQEGVDTLSFTHDPCETTGRCFIEVESDGWSSFTSVIVAEDAVCRELAGLEEAEIELSKRAVEDNESAEEELELLQTAVEYETRKFLQDLGWLLQKTRWKSKGIQFRRQYSELDAGYLKRLLVFALERNWCSLLRLLLDTVFSLRDRGSLEEVVGVLDNVHLLHRSVARNKPAIVELLVSYRFRGMSVFSSDARGLAGLTPLHVAASSRGSEAVLWALINTKAGLRAWNTVRDADGRTPSDTALATGNLSYVQMAWTRMASPSAALALDIPAAASGALEMVTLKQQPNPEKQQQQQQPSCCRRQAVGARRTMFYKPFVLSMVAVAAVCVSVCLMLRGAPDVSVVSPFTWESVRFGPR